MKPHFTSESLAIKHIEVSHWLKKMRIENASLVLDDIYGYAVDVDGDVDISKRGLQSIDVQFREVSGVFDCSHNMLRSLKGSPIKCESFGCQENLLTSLDYAPQTVDINFHCEGNLLTSLKGSPQSVVQYFCCSRNKLTTLEGAPQRIEQSFYCDYNFLTNLEHSPQFVGDAFCCNHNIITSLHGASSTVGHFQCNNNKLKDLIGAPLIVLRGFDCSHNLLTTLKGAAPSSCTRSFYCNYNQLSSFELFPLLPKDCYILLDNNPMLGEYQNIKSYHELSDILNATCEKKLLDELSHQAHHNKTYFKL